MKKLKAVVYSLGCKVNQYEGQSIIAKLNENNIETSESLGYADIYIINTCSVTGEADRKSRQMVGKALRLNPQAKIYVCGCSSQNDAQIYRDKPNVHLVGGSSGKTDFIFNVMRDIVLNNSSKDDNLVKPLPLDYEDDLFPKQTKTRGFIKIQDGCNNFCSYCIVPHLRGRSRSRSIESIVLEAEELSQSCKELVLTGINISDFGKNYGKNLVDLIYSLNSINVRKRFGSLECTIIDEEFLSAIGNGFCEHFHLSLQSGSNSVLKRMNRHYDTDFFLSRVELIRKFFSDSGITTDIIAGFPEETQQEHDETMRFLEKVKFSDMHVFPYSERKGTNAYNLKQVDKQVRISRASQISEIKSRLKENFLMTQLNKVMDVYCEDEENDYFTGYTSNYIKVYSKLPPNTLAPVKLTSLFKDGMMGEIEE